MWTAGFILWACTLIGLSCHASTPSVAVIQSAYERESSNGSKLHDLGLMVLEASCDDGATGRFLCQVTLLVEGRSAPASSAAHPRRRCFGLNRSTSHKNQSTSNEI